MELRIKYEHWLLKYVFRNIRGIVLYPFVLFKYSKSQVNDKLFRHELEHVYQVRRDGWLKFYLTYLWYQVRYGYKNNPYEIEARWASDYPLTEKEKELNDNS